MSKRAPYAGRGIPRLPTSRAPAGEPVSLGPAASATYLPEPRAALRGVLDRFVAARGLTDARGGELLPVPRLSPTDLHQIANHFTLALRNDLPSIDPKDAAAIWDEWRHAIASLREDLRTDTATPSTLVYLLDRSSRSLQLAIDKPGAAFLSYCPWRHEWATYDRLHPGGS